MKITAKCLLTTLALTLSPFVIAENNGAKCNDPYTYGYDRAKGFPKISCSNNCETLKQFGACGEWKKGELKDCNDGCQKKKEEVTGEEKK